MPPDREERFLGEHDSVRRSPRTVNAFNYFQNLDLFVKNVRTTISPSSIKFHRDVWGYFRTKLISFHPDPLKQAAQRRDKNTNDLPNLNA